MIIEMKGRRIGNRSSVGEEGQVREGTIKTVIEGSGHSDKKWNMSRGKVM